MHCLYTDSVCTYLWQPRKAQPSLLRQDLPLSSPASRCWAGHLPMVPPSPTFQYRAGRLEPEKSSVETRPAPRTTSISIEGSGQKREMEYELKSCEIYFGLKLKSPLTQQWTGQNVPTHCHESWTTEKYGLWQTANKMRPNTYNELNKAAIYYTICLRPIWLEIWLQNPKLWKIKDNLF